MESSVSSSLQNLPKACPSDMKIEKIRVDKIVRNPEQPRQYFGKEGIERLSATFKKNGDVDFPLYATPRDEGKIYKLVDGERRWRAAKMAGITHVSAVVKNLTDEEILIIMGRSFFCKKDLSPVEKAQYLSRLMKRLGYDLAEVAELSGISEKAARNLIKLLSLHPSIQKKIICRELPGKLAGDLCEMTPDQQLIVARDFEAELAKGEVPAGVNGALETIRRIAKKKKIIYQPSDNGRSKLTPVQMAANSCMNLLGQFQKSLINLGGYSLTDLNSLRGPYPSEIAAELSKLIRVIEIRRDKFREV